MPERISDNWVAVISMDTASAGAVGIWNEPVSSRLKLASQYPRPCAVTRIWPAWSGFWRAWIREFFYRTGRGLGMTKPGSGCGARRLFCFDSCRSRRSSSLSAHTIRCFFDGVRREWTQVASPSSGSSGG